MRPLLQIEWLKLRNYRTFWILSGLFIALLPLWNWGIAAGVISIGPKNMNILGGNFGFPGVWAILGWWGGLFMFFMAVLMITITSNEYSFKTHRQNVIDGWTRLQFFHAKFALVTAMSIGLCLFQFILGLIFGLANGSPLSDMTKGISDLGYYFLLCMNYLGAALMLALLIRRSGLAIALFMIYSMFVESGLKLLIDYLSKSDIGNFLPLQSSDALLPLPMLATIQKMEGSLKSSSIPEWAYVLASIVWIGIYYFAGRRLVTKRDL